MVKKNRATLNKLIISIINKFDPQKNNKISGFFKKKNGDTSAKRRYIGCFKVYP